MIVDVYIDKALPQIDQLYSYTWDGHRESLIGRRVVVPFGRGNKMEIAVVLAEREGDESKLKEVSEVMDRRPILSKEAIALGLAMRERFLTSGRNYRNYSQRKGYRDDLHINGRSW